MSFLFIIKEVFRLVLSSASKWQLSHRFPFWWLLLSSYTYSSNLGNLVQIHRNHQNLMLVLVPFHLILYKKIKIKIKRKLIKKIGSDGDLIKVSASDRPIGKQNL